MSAHAGGRRYTLVTGATGFIGHVLTAELLQRGHDCAVLDRGSLQTARETISRLLTELGFDPVDLLNSGQLVLLEGSLPDALPSDVPFKIARIVHSAASTRFTRDRSGEPFRTNDLGTAALLAWAERLGTDEFHLISTAYAGGPTDGPVPEQPLPRPRTFRNAYEHSKWMAEDHTHRWAHRSGRSCTIYRPSIVVGDHATGRASRYNGLYLALRAYERCARHARQGVSPDSPCHLPIRIEGRPGDRLNIIPVDHVAWLIAEIITRPALHGRIYNLVDPSPPSNQDILDAIERGFGVTGGRLVDPGAIVAADLSDREQAFNASVKILASYIAAPPEFERSHTAAVESALGRPWPRWDATAIRRLIEVAQRDAWGRGKSQPAAPPRDPIAAYFEQFLPERIGESGLAGMTDLTTTFRFVVSDVDQGEWVCRLEHGRLTAVTRGPGGLQETFAYRMNTPAFWDIVGARVDPQEAFLEGRAEVSGDIEQALKMGMVLQQFNREHPYRPGSSTLVEEVVHAG